MEDLLLITKTFLEINPEQTKESLTIGELHEFIDFAVLYRKKAKEHGEELAYEALKSSYLEARKTLLNKE